MEDLNVNFAIWNCSWVPLFEQLFISKDYDTNLRFVKKNLWKTTGQLFRLDEKLVSGQREATGVSLINLQDFSLGVDNLIAQSSLPIFHCQLCALFVKNRRHVVSWKKQIQWYSDNNYFKYLNRIDRQLVKLEWMIFPGFTTVGTSIRINGRLENYSESENFTGRIIFMSMFNDIVWDAKGNDESCVNDSKTNKEYAERFLRGLSWRLDPKRSGAELTMANQMDVRIELPRKCCRISKDPIIRYSGVPTPYREYNWEAKEEERHQFTSKEVWKVCMESIELLLQMVISVNQLSFFTEQ